MLLLQMLHFALVFCGHTHALIVSFSSHALESDYLFSHPALASGVSFHHNGCAANY